MAEVLDAVRDHLPPPAAMKRHVDQWRTVAQRLGAGFDHAAMCLWLVRDRDRLELRPRWSAGGEPRGIVLTLWPGERIDPRHHGRWLPAEGIGGSTDGVSALLEDADAGSIDEERIVIERPALDVDAALGTAVAMLRFAERLSGRRSAYR
jgi:hypothetical protein